MNKYTAKIEDGIVVQAIVGNADWATSRLGGTWIDTETKVGRGWTYSEEFGFRPPQPYPSWSLHEAWVWQPPVPHPDDGQFYTWDEENQEWVLINEPEN